MAPSASAILAMCADVLTRSGIVTPGQLIETLATKSTNESRESSLRVAIAPIDEECSSDNETLEFKLLKWFIEKSQLEGRQPSRAAFKVLLRNLRKKRQTNDA